MCFFNLTLGTEHIHVHCTCLKLELKLLKQTVWVLELIFLVKFMDYLLKHYGRYIHVFSQLEELFQFHFTGEKCQLRTCYEANLFYFIVICTVNLIRALSAYPTCWIFACFTVCIHISQGHKIVFSCGQCNLLTLNSEIHIPHAQQLIYTLLGILESRQILEFFRTKRESYLRYF